MLSLVSSQELSSIGLSAGYEKHCTRRVVAALCRYILHRTNSAPSFPALSGVDMQTRVPHYIKYYTYCLWAFSSYFVLRIKSCHFSMVHFTLKIRKIIIDTIPLVSLSVGISVHFSCAALSQPVVPCSPYQWNLREFAFHHIYAPLFSWHWITIFPCSQPF